MAEVKWENDVWIGDSDCATCGGGGESVEIWAYEDGTYYVSVSVGCYGGETVDEATKQKAIEVLERWIDLHPHVSRLIERIKND